MSIVGHTEGRFDVGIPVAILFTVETNGALPDGTSLKQAVELVEAAGKVAYFGVNCAHPSHLAPALYGGAWQSRIAELRPNAPGAAMRSTRRGPLGRRSRVTPQES